MILVNSPEPTTTSNEQGILQQVMAQRQSQSSSQVPTIAQIMSPQQASNSQQQQVKTSRQTTTDNVTINGHTYMHINMANVQYRVQSKHDNNNDKSGFGSLINGGATGGMSGDDVMVIEYQDWYADVTGCTDQTVKDIPLATVAGIVRSTSGPVIWVMHEYAHLGKGKTIHSIAQLEDFENDVDERSLKNKRKPGKQRIVTKDGYVFPIQIRNGLPEVDMEKPSKEQFDSFPHVIMTRDDMWDPSVLDNELNLDEFHECLQYPAENEEAFFDARVDDTGLYAQRYIAKLTLSQVKKSVLNREEAADYLASEKMQISIFDEEIKEQEAQDEQSDEKRTKEAENARKVKKKDFDWNALRPCFAYIPTEVLKRTFDCTSQFARNIVRLPFRIHLKTRFPAANVQRRTEPVATDTIWSDTPAVNGGEMAAQVFVGRNTFVTDVYGMRTDADFIGTLEDNIRKRGAMDKLISDRAQAEISKKVQDILRMYRIDDYQSKLYH